ncbi:MAG: hypothetical protein V1808_03995 [Candidatus Daviesbacteria bacterium]
MNVESIHKIDKMYGAVHGGEKTFIGIGIGDMATLPSWGLIDDLRYSPEGTLVGIEQCDPKEIRKETYNVKGTKFSFSKESKVYWKEIMQVCRERGLQIAYLDSFRLYKEVVVKNLEQRIYKDALIDFYQRNGPMEDTEIPDPRIVALNEKIYKKGIEARYILEVRREETIFENILKYKPSRVIIGRDHADYLLSDQYKLAEEGLAINDYRREYNPYGNVIFDDDPILMRLSADSEIDQSVLLERELLLRNYRVITERKLLVDGNPDYVGTWDLGCPLRGYFEVYIEEQNRKNEFWGLIEDGLGTAAFDGVTKKGGKTIEFYKTYLEGRTNSEAIEAGVPIFYSGVLKDGMYKGSFGTLGSRHDRPFILSKDPSLILK